MLSMAFLLVQSCQEEEEDSLRLPGLEHPVVTGYIARAPDATPMGAYGEPNVYTQLGEYPENYGIGAVPNPNSDFFKVFLNVPASADSSISKEVWLVPAVSDPNLMHQMEADLNISAVLPGGAPVFSIITDSDIITISNEHLPNGFYKLYCRMNGTLFYDNVVINHNFVYQK